MRMITMNRIAYIFVVCLLLTSGCSNAEKLCDSFVSTLKINFTPDKISEVKKQLTPIIEMTLNGNGPYDNEKLSYEEVSSILTSECFHNCVVSESGVSFKDVESFLSYIRTINYHGGNYTTNIEKIKSYNDGNLTVSFLRDYAQCLFFCKIYERYAQESNSKIFEMFNILRDNYLKRNFSFNNAVILKHTILSIAWMNNIPTFKGKDISLVEQFRSIIKLSEDNSWNVEEYILGKSNINK